MDFNVLTTTLTTFVGAISAGQARMQAMQSGAMRGLLIIEIALAAYWVALDASGMASIFKKLLTLCFWIWFAKEFASLAHVFSESLIQTGLSAAGGGLTEQLLLDPSSVAAQGLDTTEPLMKAYDSAGALAFKDVLLFGVSYFIIMVCYFVMAVQIFLAVIEYYLMVAIACALIPFGISTHTKFLAEKAIGAVVAVSIKLMVLALLMAVISPILGHLRFTSAEIKLNELMAMVVTCGTLAFLTWNLPAIAAAALAGSPSLSAAGITQNIASGAMMATGAIAGALGATRSAAGAFKPGGGGARAAAGHLALGAASGVRGSRSPSSPTSSAASLPRGGGAAPPPSPAPSTAHAGPRPPT